MTKDEYIFSYTFGHKNLKTAWIKDTGSSWELYGIMKDKPKTTTLKNLFSTVKNERIADFFYQFWWLDIS